MDGKTIFHAPSGGKSQALKMLSGTSRDEDLADVIRGAVKLMNQTIWLDDLEGLDL